MLKVGVVGCGSIMGEHYRHLSTMEGVTLAGHCDCAIDRAEAAAAQYGGAAFDSAITMFDAVRPDAAYITVPPYARGDIEIAAAERGIHLFIEKPLALDRDTARRVSAAIRKAQVLTCAGYCYRYCDTVQQARQYLKGKAVSLVNGCCTGGIPAAWWWRRMEKSGGQIVEQTTHLVDLLRYLCGEVAEVYAVAANGCMNQLKDYDIHDSSTVTCRLKNGATAAISSSCVAGHNARSALEIITQEATVTLNGCTLVIQEPERTTEIRSAGCMYEEENRAFIEAVRSGKRGRIRSTYSDALKTLYVTLAANDSIRSGLPVQP